MNKLDMEKLDCYMQRAKISPENLKWFDPREEQNFKVEGLYWFSKEKRYHRFPKNPLPCPNEKILALAACTAGGQLRFRSDTSRIVLSVRNTSETTAGTMAETGRSGFDLYVGTPGKEVFWNSAQPVYGKDEYMNEIYTFPEREMREFRVNFPLYNGVEELLIALDADAKILPPTPLKFSAPMVIYGTSITQGGCASRPGSAFTNILSRKLQGEFFNFGFSGNGVNDPETAQIVAAVENPALIIIDSEANSISAELVRERVPCFLDILREKHPETPVLIITKVPYGPKFYQIPILKEEFREIYQQRKAAGDKNIYFLDGTEFWDKEDYFENTVDGAHPTDLGFSLIAKKLAPVLEELLRQYGHIQ